MNENINLVEILKDCPKGTELYSPLFGKVTLNEVMTRPYNCRPISIITSDGVPSGFNSSGKYYHLYEKGECLLFPSKDQRDWNVWYNNNLKEKAEKAFQSFNDGDYIHFDNNDGKEWTVIYRKTDELEVRGYACRSDDYVSITEKKDYIGTKHHTYNARLANLEEIDKLNNGIAKFKKQWNPIVKEFEPIKIEMTISEIEIKLSLPSGSLRIKK